MKLISKSLIILFAIVSFTSCDVEKEEDNPTCFYTTAIGTTAVTGPEIAAVNEEITLTVSYILGNDCGRFLSFSEVNQSNNDKIITIGARFEGCDCVNIPINKTEPYKFKGLNAGVYNLKFKKNETQFVTHTITVE